MIDKKAIYDLLEAGKPMPSKDELWDLFFIALAEIEEFDFKSVRDILNINGKTLCYLKNRHFPEHVKKVKKRIKRVP